MRTTKLPLIVFSVLVFFSVSKASALTMAEFSRACKQSSKQCTEHPVLNAYVGGALDLIATLSEKTDYLKTKPYCKNPQDIFKVSDIIQFMLSEGDKYANDNAMVVFLLYFKRRGGCDHE